MKGRVNQLLESNYYIIDRKAQRFDKIKIAGKTAVIINSAGAVVNYGALALDDSVYAMLFCDDVRNLTLVLDKGDKSSVVTLLWRRKDEYLKDKDAIKVACGRRMSPQDYKLNRYAEAIAEKLDDGVRLRVTDAVDKSEMLTCPECGMLNPEGSPFCMECGAAIIN